MTARLMELERPKSSALTTRRRADSGRAIVRRHRAGGHAQTGAQDEQNFLALVEARWFGAEDIELAPLEFAQEPPIDGTHQFGGDHVAAIHCRQRDARLLIKMAGTFGDARGEVAETL